MREKGGSGEEQAFFDSLKDKLRLKKSEKICSVFGDCGVGMAKLG